MLKRIGAEESGELKAVASGTLPSGKPIVINSDGTVSSVSQTTSTESLGSEVQYNGQNSVYSSACFDSAAGKCVVFYRDSGSSNAGKYIVGTISGQSITYGSEDVFASASRTQYNSAVYEPVAGKIVIAYQDQDGSFYGKVRVGTLSGTSITWGTPVTFNSNETSYIEAVYHSGEGKIVIVYKNSSNHGRAIAGTVSGNSITFGTGVNVDTGGGDYMSAVYHTAANKVVAAFRATSSIGCCRVLTLSGTTITVGARQSFITTGQANQGAIAYDTTSETVVIAFRDEANTTYGSIVAGSVSGDSITYGSLLTFQSGSIDWLGIRGFASGGGVILAYDNNSSSPTNVPVKYFTISGTTITLASTVTFYSGGGVGNRSFGFAEDTTNDKMLLAFNADGIGRSKVYNPDFSTTNLTSENYIGMSKGPITVNSRTQAVGTAVQYESGDATQSNITFDSTNNKVVITYRDSNNSNYATAIVGTVDPSDNSISFGTPAVYSSSSTSENKPTFDSNAGKVVIAYSNSGNSNYGTAVVGTVSGTSISFGTPVVYNSGNATVSNGIAFDSNSNRVVISYKDQAQSDHGKAIVGSVSGTSISFGTEVTFRSARTDDTTMTFDSTNNKVVIVWSDDFHNDLGGGGGYGRAVVGTVDPSDNSISFGSIAEFASHRVAAPSIGFDPVAGKVVIAHEENGTALRAIVGTVSGTSISFGTAVQYSTATDQTVLQNAVQFDSSSGKIAIAFKDETNSVGKLIAGTVSGTSITFDDEITLFNSSIQYMAAAYDSNSERIVVQTRDTTPEGKAIVVALGFSNITRVNTADGNNVSIGIIGSVSDNQNSLTPGQQYFVQTDGTISTTAGTPSVFAGTAISTTELVVKS